MIRNRKIKSIRFFFLCQQLVVYNINLLIELNKTCCYFFIIWFERNTYTAVGKKKRHKTHPVRVLRIIYIVYKRNSCVC